MKIAGSLIVAIVDDQRVAGARVAVFDRLGVFENGGCRVFIKRIENFRGVGVVPALIAEMVRQMNDRQLEEAGVSPDLIRFSVGIEHPDDILADIRQALGAL